MWTAAVAFFCAAFATMAVVASSRRHARWSFDSDFSGPQKMHVQAVMRAGGIGIFAGLVGGGLAMAWLRPELGRPALLMLVCALPALLAGVAEDLTKGTSPRRRMMALAFSGLLGVVLLDADIVRTGWAAFDRLISANGLLWLGSAGAVFAVTGVSNSINIIDGMNGLASMCVALMAGALAYVAWRIADPLVCGISLATMGAALGFFVWNYPRGLIFLGDGGAYLLGFTVAELGILLAARHPEVSMLAPLAIMAYPIFEALFTMYRRRVLQRRPVTQADGSHLHTLIYRRLKRGAAGSLGPREATRCNSGTSPYLWLLNGAVAVPAALWWDNTPALALALLAFVLIYLDLYWRIVTFRSPKWIDTRRLRERGAEILIKS